MLTLALLSQMMNFKVELKSVILDPKTAKYCLVAWDDPQSNEMACLTPSVFVSLARMR